MSELTFQREPLAAIRDSGLDELLRAHWQEVAHDKGTIALNPDWTEYYREEGRGRFVAFTLRRALCLVGYNAFYVIRSMHYRDHIFAVNDVVYLDPAERGVDGIRLIFDAENQLRSMGVRKVFYHVKADVLLGSDPGDSLEALEAELEVEKLTGVAPLDWVTRRGGDRTAGGVLRALGYTHIENHFGKLLMETG